MPSAPTKDKFETHGTYGHSPKFVPLRDDLRSSAAFLSLNGNEQMILVDFIGHYNVATNFDRDESKITKPVLYTFGMCGVQISKNTFYRSMLTLQRHGFVIDYAGTDYKRGKATRWLATTRWMSWRADAAQLRLLNEYKERRTGSAQDPNQLRFPFVTYMQRTPAGSSSPADGVAHISQVINTVMEEAWTQNDSHHQAQRATR
jgi:hypothetical protein